MNLSYFLVYEKVAREIVIHNTDLFFHLESLGRWWDKDDEIDIVGLNSEKNALLFGEVKWSQKLVGVNVGDSKTTRNYVLFSRRGFTKEMRDLADEEGVFLFRGDEMIGFHNNKR